MSRVTGKIIGLVALSLFCLVPAFAQQALLPESVPPKFNVDTVFAEHVRALVIPLTQPAIGRYATGKQVLDRLTQQLPPNGKKFSWDLRIAKDAGNVFSSPDGTIFVDEGLAQFLGSHPGLWAAALAHEMAHVTRRDWARRYLFQKSLQQSVSAQIVVGSPGAAASSWTDPNASSNVLGAFCRNQELEADAEGLMLMARAGFHPNFMPALYHLLEGQPQQSNAELLGCSHPLWDERDEKLRTHTAAAAEEFSRLWPAPYASPGGNPPVVVYADLSSVHHNSNGELELRALLHCENIYGAVKVTLHLTTTGSSFVRELHTDTGCTSNRTVLTFTVLGSDLLEFHSPLQALFTVVDNRGDLVTRWLAPKPIR